MHDLDIARTWCNFPVVHADLASSLGTLLGNARSELTRARKASQEALATYTTCLDVEERARQQVLAAEQRRDTLGSAAVIPSSGEWRLNIVVVSRLVNNYPAEAGEGVPDPRIRVGMR